MSNVNVVFNADTQQFVASVDNASKATAKSAEAVAKAKNTIVASFKMQTQAAKEVGASHQELESIQKRTASMMASVSETNAERIVNSLNRISEKNKQVALELGALKIAAPLPSGGGHDVSDRMAASAAVRGLNGNPGIRSVENFITTIPGAAQAMQSLFPIIGAAGLAGLLYDMGQKGVEAFQKVEHAADATRDAFQSTHDKALVSIDDLEIQNQKIQDQISVISGKPNNGLATALLEAKKMADDLMVSLQGDRTQLEALLKEHSTGVFGAVLNSVGVGANGTGTQDKELLGDQSSLFSQIRAITQARDLATAGISDPKVLKAATDKYAAAIHDAYQTQIDAYARESQRLRDAQAVAHTTVTRNRVIVTHDDNSPQIANVEGRAKQLLDAQREADLQSRILVGNTQLGSAKQNKGNSEAARKAAETQMKVFEDTLNKRKQFEQLDIADEINYWDSRLAAAAKYPENLAKVNAKLGTLQQDFYKQNDADAAKAVAAQRKQVADTQRTYDDLLKVMTDWERQDEARSNSAARLEEAQSRSNIAMQEWTLSQQVATGALTRHDAAVQLAVLHASDYAKQLAELDREESSDRQRSTLTDDERATRQNDRDVKRTEIFSKRDITSAQDGVDIVASTWQGALKNANAAWVQDAGDSAKQVVDLYSQALNGLNDNLSDLMVGKKSNFAGMFQGIGKTLGTDALKHVEAPILGALGVGKADGSTANPFSVKVVGGISGGAGTSWLSGTSTDSGDSDDSDSGSKGFLGTIGSIIGSVFGGHKALGGNVQAGVTYDVGEMGREEFTPSTNGAITPHNKLDSGSTYYSVNVANGVTPEQMKVHVQSALREFHPVVVGDSVRASKADQMRNPSTRR